MLSGNGTNNNVQKPLGGERLVDGEIVAALMEGKGLDYSNGLTAKASGVQANSTPLSAVSQVDTVVTDTAPPDRLAWTGRRPRMRCSSAQRLGSGAAGC